MHILILLARVLALVNMLEGSIVDGSLHPLRVHLKVGIVGVVLAGHGCVDVDGVIQAQSDGDQSQAEASMASPTLGRGRCTTCGRARHRTFAEPFSGKTLQIN
jgi:hypothetical protein